MLLTPQTDADGIHLVDTVDVRLSDIRGVACSTGLDADDGEDLVEEEFFERLGVGLIPE